jgi:hypothetical protein
MATSSRPTSSNASALASSKRKSSKQPRIDLGMDNGPDGDVTGNVEMVKPKSARNGTTWRKWVEISVMRDRWRWMDIPLLWTSYNSSLLNVVLHYIFLSSQHLVY